MLLFALKNWRLIAIAAAVLAVAIFLWRWDSAAYDRGYAGHQSKVIGITQEKTDAAQKADEAARACATDDGCRLSDDGFRRD